MVDQPMSSALGRPVVGFNLAVNGAGPLTQLLYLQRLLQRGAKPDLVVLELSPIFFDQLGDPHDVAHFPGYVLSGLDLPTVERYARQPGEVRHEWWESQLVPIHGHRLTILNYSAQAFVPFADRLELWHDADAHGWRRRAPPDPDKHREILKQTSSVLGPRLAQYKVAEKQIRTLRDVAALLAKERIPTIMVWMPEGPALRAMYARGAIEALRAEFSALSRQHGFSLIEARAWLGEEMLVDSYHLHEGGAVAFTDRLLREAIAPALAGPFESYRSKHAGAGVFQLFSAYRWDGRFVFSGLYSTR